MFMQSLPASLASLICIVILDPKLTILADEIYQSLPMPVSSLAIRDMNISLCGISHSGVCQCSLQSISEKLQKLSIWETLGTGT